MVTTHYSVTSARVRDAVEAAVEAVVDPEIRAVTIADLGILRDIEVTYDGHAVVTITPTYSGCPAMDVIRADVVAAARSAGAEDVDVRTVLDPAWSTDWISADGRRKLADAGIAPPEPTGARKSLGPVPVTIGVVVRCPQCDSTDTQELARFGSTACKALRRCRACGEPFDHMKAF
jgi:ring-1,2-phenylacetyl-CoA epoxidase subunit PaaD